MRLQSSAWAGIALTSFAGLVLVELLRSVVPAWGGVVVGSAPNCLGVIALTFFHVAAWAQNPGVKEKTLVLHFTTGLIVVTLGAALWELVQPCFGGVFDRADLAGTGLGAGISVALYAGLSRRLAGTT